jgi:hypothetical protein
MAKKQPHGTKSHFRSPKQLNRTCPSGKIRFKDHNHAVSALHKAKNTRELAAENSFDTARKEIRSYKCKDCKGFHLTSKPQYGTTLVAA